MTFTGTSVDLGRLGGATFGVTAPERAAARGRGPGRRDRRRAGLGRRGGPRALPRSLAHGANHLVTLVAQACDLLAASGVDEPGRALGPLLYAALDNVLRAGDAALTGPVARGDAGTVAEHVRALAAADPAVLTTYRALARATADRALASGRLRPEQAEALLDALAGPAEDVAG